MDLPIPHNLDLSSMSTEELAICVWMVEERNNEPPCLGRFCISTDSLALAGSAFVVL